MNRIENRARKFLKPWGVVESYSKNQNLMELGLSMPMAPWVSTFFSADCCLPFFSNFSFKPANITSTKKVFFFKKKDHGPHGWPWAFARPLSLYIPITCALHVVSCRERVLFYFVNRSSPLFLFFLPFFHNALIKDFTAAFENILRHEFDKLISFLKKNAYDFFLVTTDH